VDEKNRQEVHKVIEQRTGSSEKQSVNSEQWAGNPPETLCDSRRAGSEQE